MISKSDYMLYLRHPAWLWLKKNDPKKIPPVDEATQALFDSGHRFEPFAESLFPEGLSLGFSDFDEYRSLPHRTKQAMDSGAAVLFQPRFEWNEFTCICDIVQFKDKDTVDLYEIKASTAAKTEHEYDLAFQTAVLEGNGLTVENIYVIHVNNQYMRRGEIVSSEITTITEVTDKVRGRVEQTKQDMPLVAATARQREMPDPEPGIAKLGSKKDWLTIYESIVPQQAKEYPPDVAPTIQYDKVSNFLQQLTYPLYFLDYETMSGLIPYFDGHRPYQQVPFQYSLHVLREPGGEVEHLEYLHRDNSDPARPLTEQLIKDIGTIGTVLVWFEGFEKARNSEIGDMLPEYKEQMEAINERVVDLIIPFKKNWYDDPRFEGSASIKNVLPILAPDLSYKTLGIQEGGSAQRLWMEAVLDGVRKDEKEHILADMVEYCKMDTWAMVRIWQELKRAVNHED